MLIVWRLVGFPGLCIVAMICARVVFCLWWIWGVFYVVGLMGEFGWFGESTWRVLGSVDALLVPAFEVGVDCLGVEYDDFSVPCG